jgi:hypothetical protein
MGCISAANLFADTVLGRAVVGISLKDWKIKNAD